MHVLLALVWLLVVVTGLWGVKFGPHSDELTIINPARRAVLRATVVPHWYFYPSLCFDICLASLIPDAAALIISRPLSEFQLSLFRRAAAQSFVIRMRSVSVVITSLAMVWTYLLVLLWRKRAGEAILAAAILGLSWETAYHGRFFTPDPIMMQFGALEMMFIVLSFVRARRGGLFLRVAALMAGLAAGSKYPGGALIVPVLVAHWFLSRQEMKPFWLEAGVLCMVFFASFLATTPGIIHEFPLLVQELRQEKHIYDKGFLYFAVSPGWGHFKKIVFYFMTAAFSKYVFISVFFFAMAVIGWGALWKKDPRMAVVLSSFPLTFLGYFTLQATFFPRFYLVVFPFAAIFAAEGCRVVQEKFFPSVRARHGFVAAISILLAINATWLVEAAHSIAVRGETNYLADLRGFIAENPRKTFLLSEGIRRQLTKAGGVPSNANARSSDPFDLAAVNSVEVVDWPYVGTGLTDRWFGPYEINFNYYPNFINFRIVLLPYKQAKRLSIFQTEPNR